MKIIKPKHVTRRLYDPLAALEAEYAAVIAQSKHQKPVCEELRSNQDEDEDESSSDQELDEYTPLPSSPYESEEEEDGVNNQEELQTRKESIKSMDKGTKELIMKSMQSLHLTEPPQWNQKVTDDELIEIVYRRLAAKQQTV